MKKLKIVLSYNIFYYCILFLVFLYLIIYNKNYKIDHVYNIKDKVFILIVDNYKIDNNKLTIYSKNLVGYYYFNNEKEKGDFSINFNDTFKVTGTLYIPNNNTIPNNFNYKKYLKYKNIEYTLNINSINLIKKNTNVFYDIKNNIYNRISNINNNEYLYAFLLGNTNFIDEEDYTNYLSNGVIHIFSISSLHISIYISLLFSLFKKLKFNKTLSFFLIILFLFLISFICSFSVSIIKATIYYIISSLNKKYKTNIKNINILIVTFIIMVIINPNYIYLIGFKYSFIISFFILLYINTFKKISLIKISLISFLSSFILIINSNYQVNILSFLSNLLFIPLVSYLVIPLCILTFLIPIFSLLLNIILNIIELLSFILSNYVNITLYFSRINNVEIIIYYILLFFCIKKYKYIKLILLLFIVFLYFKNNLGSKNIVYFNDVGQGDSSLIIINNNSILIDTGGIKEYEKEYWKIKKREFNKMKSQLIPFYKSIGLRKISYLIITHGDFDHMGEAINLVNNFKVEKVIFNCGEFNDLEKELIKVLDKKRITYYSCIKELNIDNNKLYFLQTKEYDNENDNSNVIYTELNGYKFMFMGDASVTTEHEILDKYNLSDIDVLKVGHHGSKTSSSKEFIDEINPKYSIISVGKNNRYGHPNKEVLENLKDAKIYRTDRDGSIMFKIKNKNNKLKIETCSP